MDDILIELGIWLVQKIEAIVVPLINKHVVNNYTVSSLVFVGMIFWIFKKSQKTTKKGRKRK